MISLTSKAQGKLQGSSKPYRVYVYPNVGRQLMGSNNPYVQHLKEAIGLHELDIDEATTDKAFPDFLKKGLRADMVVLNWLENLPLRRMGVLQSLIVLFYLRLLRLRGTRIVWIKHNKGTHSRKWFGLSKMIQRALIRSADHIVTHSMDIDIPDTGKLHYLPHPSNIGPEAIIRPEPAGQAEPAGRTQPVIDLLIWGSLMPYKGVLEFLRHAAGDKQLSQLNIHVAGKSSDEYWQQLQQHAGPNITLVNRFISDDELAQLFRRTRFILFTYNKRSVMSSGVLADSLAACRKIIAPHVGAFADMAQQYSFVYLYDDFSEIAALCRDHYDDYLLDYDKVRDFVVSNSWYNMGGKIKELTLLEPRPAN